MKSLKISLIARKCCGIDSMVLLTGLSFSLEKQMDENLIEKQ